MAVFQPTYGQPDTNNPNAGGLIWGQTPQQIAQTSANYMASLPNYANLAGGGGSGGMETRTTTNAPPQFEAPIGLQTEANAARIPNATGLETASSGLIGQELAGQLPQDVVNLIDQQAAERGVATGSPGSANSNAAMLRALGLTSLGVQQTGEQNLTAAYGRNPGAQIVSYTPSTTTTMPTSGGGGGGGGGFHSIPGSLANDVIGRGSPLGRGGYTLPTTPSGGGGYRITPTGSTGIPTAASLFGSPNYGGSPGADQSWTSPVSIEQAQADQAAAGISPTSNPLLDWGVQPTTDGYSLMGTPSQQNAAIDQSIFDPVSYLYGNQGG